ncbi:hypothetical protein Fcan01_21775, partial [Folsomia candida]
MMANFTLNLDTLGITNPGEKREEVRSGIEKVINKTRLINRPTLNKSHNADLTTYNPFLFSLCSVAACHFYGGPLSQGRFDGELSPTGLAGGRVIELLKVTITLTWDKNIPPATTDLEFIKLDGKEGCKTFKKISETCFLYGPIRLELAERKGNGIGLDKVELEEKKEEDDGFVGMMDHTRERWMDIIFEKYGKKIVFLEVKVVRKMGCLGSFR